jgi:hypothetical protein
MGEVVKFRRPRRKIRPRRPGQSGTIILFTGVWHGHLGEPQHPLKRTRRPKPKASSEMLAPEKSTAMKSVPRKSVRKRSRDIHAKPLDTISG